MSWIVSFKKFFHTNIIARLGVQCGVRVAVLARSQNMPTSMASDQSVQSQDRQD